MSARPCEAWEDDDGLHVQAGGRVVTIADRWDLDDADDTELAEMHAAAALMAAAPELLRVLKASTIWVARVAADHDGDGTGVAGHARRQMARMDHAIRAAEGLAPDEPIRR